ncbi:DUF1911 domain-containing protein [Amphritea balenae]|uniref:DUF1911 domain-containing protein n=2 Tax=Amphritea balenae TaxID=452629 RepID=A0A3P1SNM1_9GAMM|nr:DUF1911 domain-containing protein [Amphritea balenae]
MRLHSFITADFNHRFLEDFNFCTKNAEKKCDETFIRQRISRCDNREELRLFSYQSSVTSTLDILLYTYLLGHPSTEGKEICNKTLQRQLLMKQELDYFELTGGDKIDLNDQQKVSLFLLYSIVNGLTDQDRRQFAEGTPAGVDRFVDRLLQRYQPERDLAEHIEDPRMFKHLYKVFDAEPEQRPALIKDFLENWEERIKKGYHPYMNWGCHEDPDSNFDGYWCFPAAAVVAALNIDDSEFIDYEYYPGDLMREVAKYRGEPVTLPSLDSSVPQLPEAPAEIPVEQPWPEDMQPYSKITNLICSPLPESLRIGMRNALVGVIEDPQYEVERPLQWSEYLYCLSQAQGDIELNRDYKRCVLLHVDWKDADNALFYTQQTARTAGLPEFDTEQAITVPDVLDAFRTWLSAQGWDLYCPSTGDDNYMAYIAPQTVRSQYEAELLEMDQPFYRGDSEETSENHFKLLCQVIEQGNSALAGLDNDPLRVASALMTATIHYSTFALVGNGKYLQELEINQLVKQFRERLEEDQALRQKKLEQDRSQE